MAKKQLEKRRMFVWTDLETTGLNQDEDRILEYAVVITDENLQEFASHTAIVQQHVNVAKHLMNDFVQTMHTENGLLLEIQSNPACEYVDSIRAADDKISGMILDAENLYREAHKDCQFEIEFIAAGSNIIFDIKFILEQLPWTASFLKQRSGGGGPESFYNLDVSVYKMAFPRVFVKNSEANHRAMDDIRWSIEQHKIMQKMMSDACRINVEDQR